MGQRVRDQDGGIGRYRNRFYAAASCVLSMAATDGGWGVTGSYMFKENRVGLSENLETFNDYAQRILI